MSALSRFSVAAVLFFAALAHAAPPNVTYLFPAGAARGQTVGVTAAGAFPSWPVQVAVDRPGVTAAAEADSSKFKISVAPDAEPGIYWLRMFNAEGASTPRPFLVGTLPEVEEVEPNDTVEKPQLLPGSVTVNGRLGKSGDIDGFLLSLKTGQTVVAALEGNTRLGSPMDAVMQLCLVKNGVIAEGAIQKTGRLEAFVLEQAEDTVGLDPRLEFTAKQEGLYLIRTFAFPATADSSIAFAGADSFVYRLTITTGGFLDFALPLAQQRGTPRPAKLVGANIPAAITSFTPTAANGETMPLFHPELANDFIVPVVEPPVSLIEIATTAAPHLLVIPSVVSGRLTAPREAHVFRITATKSQRIRFDVEARAIGFAIDPHLTIADATGKQLNEVDDAKNDRDPEFVFTSPADGEYQLTLRDVHGTGGPRHAYRLFVTEPKPDFQISVASDSFVAVPGTPLEIAVSIERKDGLTGPLEIKANDLPAGVTATPVVSHEGESAKSVKLVFTATADAAAFNGPLKIIGVIPGSNTERTARSGSATTKVTHPLWLTVGTKPAK